MAEVLSQKEIDQLLDNINSGIEEEQSVSTAREAIPFDFRLPNRISKNQLRTIRNINENFAEIFSSFLMSKLQTIININVISVDQIYYSEYVLSVSNPSCLFTFDIEKTDIKGILELSPELALTLVDRLLGGYGSGSKQSKIITPIEQNVIGVVVERILQDMNKAWQMIGDYVFKLDKFEPDIDFAQITSQSESVLLITYEIFIGEQSYLMNFCYATYAFDTILSKLTRQNLSTIRPVKYKGTTAKHIVMNHLNKTELVLEVEFGKAVITFNQIMSLKTGDVISLEKRLGDDLEVKVDNTAMFYGTLGTINNHKAIKITRRVEKKE